MISKRQYKILSFYMTRALFLGGGFTLLIKLGMNDFLIVSILGMLLGYFLLYLFFKKGKLNKIVNILIAIFVLIMTTLSNTMLTSNYLLYNTPTLLILLIFISSLVYASFKDIVIGGRISEVFSIVSFIEITLSILILFNLVNMDRMLPLFTTRFINIIKGIICFTGSSLLPNLLLLNYKEDIEFKEIHLGYIVGCLLMIAVMFLVVSIYGSTFASMVRFPEFLILKKVNLMGYLSNIENVLVTEWLFCELIVSYICIKVLKDNMNIKTFFTIIILLGVGSEIVLNRHYVNVLFIKDYFYYVAFGLVICSLLIKKSKN